MIASPRHTREDLRVWAEREAMDHRMFAAGALNELEMQALGTLRAFLELGSDETTYVSVSWGKDSTVVAHLVHRLVTDGLPAPRIIWCPAGKIENPDCATVRDLFLARFPLRYEEHPAELTSDEWDRSLGHDGAQAEFERVTKRLGVRYVSGVRAEESGMRKISLSRLGLSTKNTCRPIGWWRHEHVFAYLAGYDLPVHPAYACSFGGARPRSAIRVGTIGGARGTGFGRAEWERRYYGAELRMAGL